MANMIQTPAPGDFLLRWRGDALPVTLKLDVPRPGRAAFRTNLGNADVRRQEIIDATEKGLTPLARAWSDIPLPEVAPGVFRAVIPLDEVGIFSGKACFFADGDAVPQWPEGRNTHIKVETAETRRFLLLCSAEKACQIRKIKARCCLCRRCLFRSG